MSFAGQVAVITGASSGMGYALAQELARQGCRVGLLARREELIAQLASTIRQQGGQARHACADVGNRAEVNAAIAELTADLGPIDLLIANAGMGIPTRVEPLNIPDIERLFQVNFFGVLYAIEAVLPAMLARGTGHLAAVSSLGAYKGLAGQQGYSASKAALNNFMEGLRIQVRERGIHVTTLCPGFVRTPMTAHHRFYQPFLLEPEQAARMMIGALRRRRKVFNFPWPMALLMKATAWVPDWLMARQMRKASVE